MIRKFGPLTKDLWMICLRMHELGKLVVRYQYILFKFKTLVCLARSQKYKPEAMKIGSNHRKI